MDLDESAVREASARWPEASFLCADAADLPARYPGHFDVALIRRPNLFAQPERWQRVFATLPRLLRSGGRVFATFVGEREAAAARAWLEKAGIDVIHAEELPTADELHFLVGEAASQSPKVARVLALDVLEDDEGRGAFCDATTGECFLPWRGTRI